MKKIFGIMVAVAFLAFISPTLLTAQIKYPYKSTIINYKISGSMQQGTQETYIDDYGEKTCSISDSTVNMGGYTHKSKMMNIYADETMYIIDLEKNTGTKTTITKAQREQMMNMAKQMIPTVEDIKNTWNNLGTETIIGKPCKIYQNSMGKVWIWNDIILKQDINFMGMGSVTMEATSISVDVPIPASKFSPPSGIVITEQQLPSEMPMDFSLD